MADAVPLVVRKDDAVATLWIDRPEKRNAISFAMLTAFPGLVERVENDDEIRVLVIRGAGEEAFSAGAEIALACDLRFADTRARFGVTPARLGLVYGLTATKQLCDLVGPAVAKWLLFSGEHLSARRAHQVGLVDELLEPDRLEARTYAFARRIASRSQTSVRASKRIVAKIAAGQIEDDAETRALREAALDADDVQEGVRAFLEKRPPEFG